MFDNINWGLVIPIAIGVILLLLIIITGYIKAPPDTAYIISGLRRKIIIGKASIRIPFFERVDKLKLQLIAVDVKTSSAVPTADYININVDANVNVKVSSDPQLIKLGAVSFQEAIFAVLDAQAAIRNTTRVLRDDLPTMTKREAALAKISSEYVAHFLPNLFPSIELVTIDDKGKDSHSNVSDLITAVFAQLAL